MKADPLKSCLQERDAVVDKLRVDLLRGQHLIKLRTDDKRTEVTFEVSDLVF